MNEKVFKDEELSRFYVFSNKKLPTVNDCLLYVLSRTNKEAKREQTRVQTIWELAKIVLDVWDKADCCPHTRKHIVTLFEKNAWNKYTYLMRENHLPRDNNTTKRSYQKDIQPNIKKKVNLLIKVDQSKHLKHLKHLLTKN